MKTFEEFQNKRYDLQENKRKDDLTSSPRVKATGDILKSGSKPTASQKQTADNVLGNLNRFFTDKSDSETMKTKPTGDEGQFKNNKNVVNREIKKTIPGKSKKISVGALDKRDAAIKKLDKVIIKPKTGDVDKTRKLISKIEKDITKPKVGEKTKAKTIVKQFVDQRKVSQKAKDFTKEINKKRTGGFENVTGEGKVKYPKNRKDLIAKRKEYGIDRKGNISDAGVKRYAQKTKQLSSGSNIPVTPTKKELDIAKTRAVGGKTLLGKGTKGVKDKIIGTTTGKYGGRLPRARNKNMKTYDQIKKEIDLKDLQKASNYKAAGIARSKELKRLNKEMGEKALKSKIQSAKTFAPSTKADRQFYKAGRKITKILPKKAAPVAKKGLKLLTKAGPAGRIAGAVGLAMLSPGVRKTAAKIVGATAVGLGLTKAAGSGIGKKPIKPTVTRRKYGINLSQKDNK